MNKTTICLKSPLLTQSGYGQHARMLFDALFEDKSFEVFCENINWGVSSFLTHETDQFRKINACLNKREMLRQQNPNFQFDIFIHVTIPQEFERQGKFNVGVTAMVETDRISHQWIQKCNEMDLIIVPSEHSKFVAEKSVADWVNQNTGERGELRITKPIVVCPEGVDTNIFKPARDNYNNLLGVDFAPDFCFLHVGQWGRGNFGEDRKNISNLVKYFIETFKGRKDVGLILKTNMGKNSPADKEICLERLRQIKAFFPADQVPPIYLIHGNLREEEMASLYNHPKVRAYVSLSHGEGFGIPLLEAAMCDLPIVTIPWSGHTDFLNLGKYSKVKYELKEIPDAAVWDPVLIKGSRWAVEDPDDVRHRLSLITTKYSHPRDWAKELGAKVREGFSLEKIKEIFVGSLKKAALGSETAGLNPIEWMKSYVDNEEDFNVLFTMPRSHGDVYLSTAVLDGLMKDVPEGAKVYFATSPQYFPILEDNPHIHKVIPYQQFMMMTDFTEEVFDLALTPDVATQYQFSNWIRRGQSRNLVEEYANHCNCEIGDFFIKTKDDILSELPKEYMTVHIGSGKGQWEARKYIDWQEVINNLLSQYEDATIVQVGSEDEPLLEGVVDMRGKTDVHQMASVLKNSSLHLGIDSFPMHLAAGFGVPVVALFGSSYAHSTGPYIRKGSEQKYVLLESETRMGCQKACYKNTCKVNKEMPCINEIDAYEVFQSCVALLN